MSSRDYIYITALVVLNIALFFVPTGFEKELPKYIERAKVRVLSTDNSLVETIGVIRTGTQQLTVQVENGPFKGTETKALNRMMGKIELDKLFQEGDTAYASLKIQDGNIRAAIAHDYHRIDVELLLFGLFFLVVVLVAGLTGLRAILTFIFTGLFLWRVLLPAFLRGWDPIPIALLATAILSFVIIFAIAGFTKKGVVAFLGSIFGVLITCGLSIIFAGLFHLHGAVRPFSEMLLFTGFPALKLSDLFLAGIFIASSGAVMDIAMDISASMNELVEQNVKMTIMARFKSGMAVGKAVIGTMTTTLLLAYTGGYTFMFMSFLAQGKTMVEILNNQYVSAELLHTLIGSFGLVLVAPLTAISGAIIFKNKENIRSR